MYRFIRSGELQPSPGGTVTFEGDPYGSGVSFFLVNNEPGQGPDLHKHPYSETWIVRGGKARLTADGVDIEAGPGDIAVVSSETPHKFKNIGTERLDIICIHSSPRIIQEELKSKRPRNGARPGASGLGIAARRGALGHESSEGRAMAG